MTEAVKQSTGRPSLWHPISEHPTFDGLGAVIAVFSRRNEMTLDGEEWENLQDYVCTWSLVEGCWRARATGQRLAIERAAAQNVVVVWCSDDDLLTLARESLWPTTGEKNENAPVSTGELSELRAYKAAWTRAHAGFARNLENQLVMTIKPRHGIWAMVLTQMDMALSKEREAQHG